MDTETEDWAAVYDRILLKDVSLIRLEQTIARAVSDLIGKSYRARVDSIEFSSKLLEEKAKLSLRIELIGTSPSELFSSHAENGVLDHETRETDQQG